MVKTLTEDSAGWLDSVLVRFPRALVPAALSAPSVRTTRAVMYWGLTTFFIWSRPAPIVLYRSVPPPGARLVTAPFSLARCVATVPTGTTSSYWSEKDQSPAWSPSPIWSTAARRAALTRPSLVVPVPGTWSSIDPDVSTITSTRAGLRTCHQDSCSLSSTELGGGLMTTAGWAGTRPFAGLVVGPAPSLAA